MWYVYAFGIITFAILAVCIEKAKPVKQVAQGKSQWQSSADQMRARNYTFQFKELQTANYKDWFHSLLSLEERHAGQQLNQAW